MVANPDITRLSSSVCVGGDTPVTPSKEPQARNSLHALVSRYGRLDRLNSPLQFGQQFRCLGDQEGDVRNQSRDGFDCLCRTLRLTTLRQLQLLERRLKQRQTHALSQYRGVSRISPVRSGRSG